MIEIKNLNYSERKKQILKNINIKIPKNKFVGIIGANGAGKSTLLKCIYGINDYIDGRIELDGILLDKIKRKERAKLMSVLSQEERALFDYTVEQIVEMGRYPYKKFYEAYDIKDKEIVMEILKKVGLEKYKEKEFNSLSGGEKQRVLIARALVQETPYLILDEPTNHLDIGYQLHLLHFIKNLNKTVIAVLHDLNITAMYCDYIFVMKNGEIYSQGEPEKILTKELLREVFNVEAQIIKNQETGKIQILYTNSHYHIDGVGTDHCHDDNFTGIHSHN